MKNKIINSMKIEFRAKSANEAFARSAVASFASLCDPSVGVIADIKTIVSEAVTNAVVHAYADKPDRSACPVYIICDLYDNGRLRIKIRDHGRGIEDITRAMEPMFTTDAENERSGMGFTVMQSFYDRISVRSAPGKGTTVTLVKELLGN